MILPYTLPPIPLTPHYQIDLDGVREAKPTVVEHIALFFQFEIKQFPIMPTATERTHLNLDILEVCFEYVNSCAYYLDILNIRHIGTVIRVYRGKEWVTFISSWVDR